MLCCLFFQSVSLERQEFLRLVKKEVSYPCLNYYIVKYLDKPDKEFKQKRTVFPNFVHAKSVI